MLTATLIRDTIKGVVSAHQEGLTFRSWWETEKDKERDPAYPVVAWMPPNISTEVTATNNLKQSFQVELEFVDRVTPDRTTDDRDAVHAKMAMVATQVFARFVTLYVQSYGTVNGQRVDLEVTQPMTLDNFWDEPGSGETGVRMRFAVRDANQMACTDFSQAFA